MFRTPTKLRLLFAQSHIHDNCLNEKELSNCPRTRKPNRMIRNLAILFLLSLFATGCGGGGGEETLNYGEIQTQCIRSNLSFPFPGGTTCRGLDVSPSDLITPQREYWHCRDSDGETREYYFSDGTGRMEIVRGILPVVDASTGNAVNVNFAGAHFNFRWSLNTETCSLWARFDQSLCGVSGEVQIADVSANSITTEAANPDNLSDIVSSTCRRRRTASADSPAAAERAVRAEAADDDNPDASGGGVLSLARKALSGGLGAE